MALQSKNRYSAHEDMIREGLEMTKHSVKDGGWAELLSGKLAIQDPVLCAETAWALENTRSWLENLDETTRSSMVGGFIPYIYPVIRASYPNNPIHQLVSVQQQTKRQGQIFWINTVIGRSKGKAFRRGDRLFDASTGWSGKVGYTDETVVGENLGAGAAATAFAGSVSRAPVRRGQFTVRNGTAVFTDNMNGGLLDAAGAAAGAIDYATGAVSLAGTTANPVQAAPVEVDYRFDGEGNDNFGMIDMEFASAPVEATPRKVAMKYSIEAYTDAKNEFGLMLDQTLVTSCSQTLIADSCGEVVRDLWEMAGPPVETFDISGYDMSASGPTKRQIYTDILEPVVAASESIYQSTQKGEATWMIVDSKAAIALQFIGAPLFIANDDPFINKKQGLVNIGKFNGKWDVWRYIFLKDMPGAASGGNILMGWKGPDFWDSGYVWAPYQDLYMSEKELRYDFTARQGFMMRYAKRPILRECYVRVAINAA